MMKTNQKALLALVAMGLAGTAANAQFFTDSSGNNYNNPPFLITITGATLQRSLFENQASTNDFIDLDDDSISGQLTGNNERLLPFPSVGTAGGTNAATQNFFNTYYRAVGSVNGVVELVAYGNTFRRTPAELTTTGVNPGLMNRTTIIANGAYNGNANGNAANPGAAGRLFDDGPGANFGGTVPTTYVVGPNTFGGIRADIAPSDVAPQWIDRVDSPADANPFRTPLDLGFGDNQRTAVDPVTGAVLTQTNRLPDFSTAGLFSTFTAFAPIGPMTNFGIGYSSIKFTDLRHGYATGRTTTGENLIFMTRDIGSGTRNGFANGIGLDPSWCVGENVGAANSSTTTNRVGAGYIPTNKNSSSGLRDAIINTRLGVGQYGVELGINDGIVTTTALANVDFFGVINDVEIRYDNGSSITTIPAGTMVVRPVIENLTFPAGPINLNSTWLIGGNGTLATLGDPRNENEVGGDAGNTNARMPNPAAAAYINNITRSLAAVSAVPTDPANEGSPGQFIAQELVAPSARRYLQSNTDGLTYVNNATFSTTTYDWTIGINPITFAPNHRLNTNALRNANTLSNGRVPQRNAGTYSDSSLGFAPNYRTEDGVTLVQGSDRVPARSKVAGDFDGNGVRNASDIDELVRAYAKRNLGFTYSLPSPAGACLEILGDFNSDGSFNLLDVRYFADGLALYTGSLNRKQGFIDADDAFAATGLSGSLFFGSATNHSTGAAINAGDARADVAGKAGTLPARGWAPIAADGVLNAADIDYVAAQWHEGTVDVVGGVGRTVTSIDWSNLEQAVNADLAADVNGDLMINNMDSLELIHCILVTSVDDFNLDGTGASEGDAADQATHAANLGLAGGFAQGDANGDGLVTAQDLCLADVNLDGVTDFGDFLDFFNGFDNDDCKVDITGAGSGSDFGNFLTFFNGFDVGC